MRQVKVLRAAVVALAVVGVVVSAVGAWLCDVSVMDFGTPFIIAELLVVGWLVAVQRRSTRS